MTVPTSIVSTPGIDLAHHKTHEGNHYAIHRIIAGVTIAAPKYFLIIPPPVTVHPHDTIEIHVLFEVRSINIGFTVQLFENTDATGVVPVLTPLNFNRRSTTTAQTVVYEGLATLVSTGSLLYESRVGTVTTGGTAGMVYRDEDEIIFKPGLKYLISIVPLADNLDGNIYINWYDNRPGSPVPIPP